MEISTTMTRFSFPKSGMEKKTEKAQLFLCGDAGNPTKVWVPLNKLDVKESKDDESMNIVTMPKWLFMKTDLPFFANPEEFIVSTEVQNI